jgi:hypothetical protein
MGGGAGNNGGSGGAGAGGATAGSGGATAGTGGATAGTGGDTGGAGGATAGAGGAIGGAGGDTGGTGGATAGTGGATAGTGGATAGTGGAGGASAGTGGATAGAGGSGGAAGTGAGGTGGSGGAAGAGGAVSATGVMMLSVPLTATGQGQRYNVNNTTVAPATTYDLSGATLTIRAYAPGALGGDLSIFLTSTMTGGSSVAMQVGLSTLTTGFVDIVVPVPAASAGGYDPALTDVIRIEVEAGAAFGTAWQTPATIVYIDSVISSNGAVNDPFDTNPPFGTFGSSGARQVTNSAFSWLATYP